ncbi:MAG: molybdopterin-binding protein [Candidatus Bathyarchaeia archaeon]
MRVRVEIFAIGSELCYGRVYDTNSFWIADQATRLGSVVQRITCIPDDAEGICAALREALTRGGDFIILTGGLGPTSDDLTIEALSRLLGVEVIINQEILQAMAERRGVPVDALPPNLVRMTRSLKGAECLPNPVGWAPVTVIEAGKATIAALPGPPREMQTCFTTYIAKRIQEKTRCCSVARRVLVTMYESQVSPLTDEVMKNVSEVYLKPLVGEYQRDRGLPVDIVAFAEDEDACRVRMDEAVRRLGELVAQKGGRLEQAA